MHTDLKTARERKGLTQVALAQLSSVSAATISRIEAGLITNPSNWTAASLEAALKVKRGTLVFGEPKEQVA